MQQTIIKVVDSIMGSGKTSAAIDMMNNDKEHNYIFITPYLDEVQRIKETCTSRKFYEPKVYSKHGDTFYKMDSLHQLLTDGKNIATTHALFKMATKETRELIDAGNYILILDEVMEVVKQLNIGTSDIEMLLETEWMINDNGHIKWNLDKESEKENGYDGEFQTVRKLALNNNLILHNNTILIWNFPAEIFTLFSDVYVLTYLFDAQIQKYYYDINNIQYVKLKAEKQEDKFVFIKSNTSDKAVKDKLKKLINIYEGDLNNIGDNDFTLSMSWYSKKKHMHKKMKNNILNYYQNIMKSKSDYNLWTTFKDYKSKLSGKGYTKGFLACNVRATNLYSHKNCLVYTVNRFINPIIGNFFSTKGVLIDEDRYALSELIQWIWRGAIRNNEPINLYIPSKRMRELLYKWLDDQL
jgi:hypothetical protein